jgi:glucose-6-phosphate isomerase
VTQYKPTATTAWHTLTNLAQQMSDARIETYFDQDPSRAERYSVQLDGFHVDYSKHLISDEVFTALQSLAAASPLLAKRDAMFRGDKINLSEDRAVLHTALRRPRAKVEVDAAIDRMIELSNQVRTGQWTGYTGQRITNVVNIGIGGSDLGPRMVCVALEEFKHPEMNFHFISNVDGAPLRSLLGKLDPASTLFVISSKTFTTQETMLNAETAINWFRDKTGIDTPLGTRHFLAVTAATETAKQRGIADDQILEFWDWVGGRYSLWSSIGLSICLSIGATGFRSLLDGAAEMDEHFLQAPTDQNLPIVLALIGIWYGNFLNMDTTAVIPYCERLSFLPAFLQQLDMESNGKSATVDGSPVDCATGPILWGQTGTNGQHAFFQLLHQGTRTVPVDFIGVVQDNLSDTGHHRVLLANMLAQGAALMCGEQSANHHQSYAGNKPSTTILLDQLTPRNLGRLIALYEHRVFCQGAIWDINSFDQWGVELGKRLASRVLDDSNNDQFDASTRALLQYAGF